MVSVGGHLLFMANLAVPLGSDGAGNALILNWLDIIPISVVHIDSGINGMCGTMAGNAHHAMVVGPVTV